MRNYSLAAVLLALPLQAEIIYDNSTTFLGSFNDSVLETGDEINLAGTARLATAFSFEYYAEFTPTGDETGRVRFYEMNGAPGDHPFATPGTLLYDSGSFSISSGYKTVNITELSTLLPGTKITWSVEFSGLTSTESAGLLYYNPPAVGSSDDYFWQKENGAWSAVATDGTSNNFAARLTAVDSGVPPRIANVQHSNGVATLTVTGATAGRNYALDFKDIVTGTWQRAAGQVTATGETVILTDNSAAVPHRFYRVAQVN